MKLKKNFFFSRLYRGSLRAPLVAPSMYAELPKEPSHNFDKDVKKKSSLSKFCEGSFGGSADIEAVFHFLPHSTKNISGDMLQLP
jgi:hypothetical protein